MEQIDDDFKKCESDKEELQDKVRSSLSNLNGRRGSYEGDIERAEVRLKECKALNAEITIKLNSKENKLNECFIKTKQLPTVPPQLSSSCLNLTAGVHEIQIENGKHFNVACDGDGWLIIQQRFNGSQDFNKTWKEYTDGFGDLQSEFFIGLENLHLITSLKRFELHIGVTFEWGKRFAHYDNFRITGAESLYELEEIGHYEGDEFNALAEILKTKFTTFDLNNIAHSVENCAEDGMGGWWYSKYCGNSNLNARYEGEIRWYLPKVKSTIMKIRPNSDGN
ncbi:fibrinogen-like protein 1 [Drosophila albomicans]|uniref:Fibrinogen-like protein 1 n=1 Tax=Drosophila albomicans TaxID=7291 RepID=A0A6P8WJ24_DROAB|nr:fibrinogen-like protein 1 [Drosophila albomicans]